MSVRRRTRALATVLTPQPTSAPVGLRIGTVSAVSSTVTTVTVGVDQVDVLVRCASYSPAVNDVVLVLLNGSSPVLVDRLVGVTAAN